MPWSFLCRRGFAPALLVVAGWAATPLSGATAPRCAVLEVSSAQTPQTMEGRHRTRRQRRFSATEILDVEIHVFLPASLEGEHRLDVKVYTPDSQLYQILTVPFEAAETAATAENGVRRNRRKLSGILRPLPEISGPVQRAEGGRTRYRKVSATLPVAGTSIVSSSLYGTWAAAAFLDGSATTCGPDARFVITE